MEKTINGAGPTGIFETENGRIFLIDGRERTEEQYRGAFE